MIEAESAIILDSFLHETMTSAISTHPPLPRSDRPTLLESRPSMNPPLNGVEETFLRVQQDGKHAGRSPKGHLVVLPTKAEVEARFKPLHAYITTVSAQRASLTLKYCYLNWSSSQARG